MPRSKQLVVGADKHTLRLIQQVPAGTAGAFVDPIMGRSWVATRRGLNGAGGFISVENNPILGDASEFTLTIPSTGSDGRDHRDRFYYFAGTPNPRAPSSRVGYMPGDEWIEVYRGRELVAIGTPVSEVSTPGQIQMLCRDVVALPKKTRETAAGFWNHSPRDVFEHYTRGWEVVAAEDFNDPTLFPVYSQTGHTTTDGRLGYSDVKLVQGSLATLQRLPGPYDQFTDAEVQPLATITDSGPTDHGGWRFEVRMVNYVDDASPPAANVGIVVNSTGITDPGGTYLVFGTRPKQDGIFVQMAGVGGHLKHFPVNTAGLTGGGKVLPPYTFAVEARERWIYFYVNGQQVAVVPRTSPVSSGSGSADLSFFAQSTLINPDYVTLDYLVLRKTTPPFNGGQPGDYRLASPPAPGGLSGQFYDQSQVLGQATDLARYAAPPTDTPVAERIDPTVHFTTPAGPSAPSWFPSALALATRAYVRWTGAIWLPLTAQDVHFVLPSDVPGMQQALFVGRTRAGEAVCTSGSWYGETAGTTSVSMRSVLGSISGWYPLVFEYLWSAAAGAHTCGFTYV